MPKIEVYVATTDLSPTFKESLRFFKVYPITDCNRQQLVEAKKKVDEVINRRLLKRD